MSTIVSRNKFELSDRELVITRRYLLPAELLRRMQALADAAGHSLEEEVLQWFEHYLDDHEGRDDDLVKDQIEDWLSKNKWSMASWIMYHALDKYGEWELYDNEEDFAEQRRVFFCDGEVSEECEAELDRAVACALKMDGAGARRHAFAAAKFWWTDEDEPWEAP